MFYKPSLKFALISSRKELFFHPPYVVRAGGEGTAKYPECAVTQSVPVIKVPLI